MVGLDKIMWDIISTVSSALLSLVAIIISIGIANRQNKIGLFEKRFEVYCQGIEFFNIVSIYQKNNDHSSITMIELAELENKLDINIEKSKYLFDDTISNLLTQGKEYFIVLIRLYKVNDPNQQKIEDIKIKVTDCKTRFESKVSKYLKL